VPAVSEILLATSVNVSATNNADIDGLLAGTKWSGTISYSFPTSASTYGSYSGGNGEPTTSGFSAAPTQMQVAINYAIALIQGYTNASITYNGSGSADIMVAQSPAANPTSYAYYPGNYAAGGDVWFGTQYDYTQAKLGNYYFTTALHELGHALGLKHSQETGGVANVAVPTAHDDSEYTVMSYRSYVGGPLTGYTNEQYGYPETYMANDILALQTLYGANYNTQSGNTVYTWSPTTGQEFINGVAQLAPGGGVGGSANRIYETVWDGNGVDTYDLSNYTTNLTINLNPGASSVFSSTQLAYLGNGHYAAGNVYNAYLYNGDTRSLIDNATGGSGNDTIIGNAIANVLNGGSGNDTITGGGGNDTIIGGAGTDTAVYSGNEASYSFSYNSSTATFTITDLRAGSPDGTDTVTGVEYFQFADGTFASSSFLPVTIEAYGATSLVQVGSNFYFYPVGGSSGPEFKYHGTPVVAGQLDSWSYIGAEQTSSGYEVALHVQGTDQYTVWNTDSNGSFVSNGTGGIVSGTSAVLEALEASFQQDLNGDGTIGPPTTTVIETHGATSLVQVGLNYYFYPVGGSSGPEFKYHGTPVIAGQLDSWSYIGAEQTSSGYEVALHVQGTDQYTVWNTDSNGSFVSNGTGGIVSGTSAVLEALEASFQQDLNGDGTIGPTSAVISGTVIEAHGATSLVQVGLNYYFYPVGGSSGPEFKYHGTPVVQGQLDSWSYIGAEQTSSGYEVALHVQGTDQYTVWNTDSSGSFVSNGTGGIVSGTSSVLEALEPSFQQDLNGDGTIGPPTTTVIEAQGATSLVQVGSNFYFYPVGGSSGPEFKYHGTPVVAGQLDSWSYIGAEQTSSGYEVALHVQGTDQYTVWNTDSSGSFVSNGTGGIVSGTSSVLEALEPSFQQDLNGDGTIGLASSASSGTVIEAQGSTSLVQVGSNFYFYPVGGSSGPEFKYHGTSVVAGQLDSWSYIGAERTSSGYEVALHVQGTDQYTVWNTDSSGSFVSNGTGGIVSGTSSALEALEPSFQQDLNGDGTIGVPAHSSPTSSDPLNTHGLLLA
jgi:serralysin